MLKSMHMCPQKYTVYWGNLQILNALLVPPLMNSVEGNALCNITTFLAESNITRYFS